MFKIAVFKLFIGMYLIVMCLKLQKTILLKLGGKKKKQEPIFRTPGLFCKF